MEMWQHIVFGFLIGFLLPGFMVRTFDIVVDVSLRFRIMLGLLGILGQMAPNIFEHTIRTDKNPHAHSFWHSWSLFFIFGATTLLMHLWLSIGVFTFILSYMGHILLDYFGISDGIPGFGPIVNPLKKVA